jgi:uncharacterized protein (DUF1778 family)
MPRPPRTGAPAAKRLHVRLTDEELAALREAAGECGESTSQFVRLAVGDAIEQFKEERRVFERRRADVPVAVDRRTGKDRRQTVPR